MYFHLYAVFGDVLCFMVVCAFFFCFIVCSRVLFVSWPRRCACLYNFFFFVWFLNLLLTFHTCFEQQKQNVLLFSFLNALLCACCDSGFFCVHDCARCALTHLLVFLRCKYSQMFCWHLMRFFCCLLLFFFVIFMIFVQSFFLRCFALPCALVS
jgi:hypothetical protein